MFCLLRSFFLKGVVVALAMLLDLSVELCQMIKKWQWFLGRERQITLMKKPS